MSAASPSRPGGRPGRRSAGRSKGRSEDGSPGRLRRLFARLVSDPDAVDAQRVRRETEAAGGTPCAQLPDRARVTAGGTVRNVTVRPRAGVPTLEVELHDGSGAVTVVFLGRRRIAGVEPGREMVVHGLVCDIDGRPTMYNPRYELRPVGAA